MKKKIILLFFISILLVSCSNNGGSSFTAFPELERWISKDVISNAAKMRKEYAENWEKDKIVNLQDESNNEHVVTNCKEAFTAVINTYFGADNGTTRDFNEDCNACVIMNLLLKSKKAQVSYLTNFKLDRIITDDLPAKLSGHNRLFAENGDSSSSWGKVDGIISSEFVGNVLSLKSADIEMSISLLAKGDFNGDGIEDLILDIHYNPIDGHMFSNCLAVITKLSKADSLKLLVIYDSMDSRDDNKGNFKNLVQ